MPKFDLTKTQEVQDLFATPRDQRDQNWRDRFFAAIVDASMSTPSNQVISGPDSFPYFVLNLPPVGQPFETFCVSHILDVCLENGFGVVIQPDANPPQWVFPYGRLWSLKELGKLQFEMPPQPAPGTNGEPANDDEADDGTSLFVGQPSIGFFPAYARKVIKEFLTHKMENATPQVMLVTNPKKVPVQSLVFSVFAEDFADRQEFDDIMYRLTWFLPTHYGLLSIAKDADIAQFFQPL
jgi:hypothetical protein